MGVPVYCHPDEVDGRRKPTAAIDSYMEISSTCRWRRVRLAYPLLLRRWDGGAVKIDGTVGEGDDVAGFEVIHFPGHARGLIGLWRESDRLALVSDVIYLIDSVRLGNPCRRARRASPIPPGPGTTRRRRTRCASWRRSTRRSSAPATPSRCAARACARRWNGLPRSTEPVVSAPLMLGTYASAALICAASMLVGRAVLSIAGRSELVLAGAGGRLRRDHHRDRPAGPGGRARDDADPGRARARLAVGRRRPRLPYRAPGRRAARACRSAIAIGLVFAIPFLVSGRWGLHRGRLQQRPRPPPRLGGVAAQRLRPEPDAGYPLGPHGLAVAVAAVPGLSLGQAFIGEIFAIGALTGLTALAALRRARRRRGARSRRSSSPSPTSPPPTSPRAPSRRPPRRSSSSPSPSPCATPAACRRAPARGCACSSRSSPSPAASSSPTASPASPGRWRSSRSGA